MFSRPKVSGSERKLAVYLDDLVATLLSKCIMPVHDYFHLTASSSRCFAKRYYSTYKIEISFRGENEKQLDHFPINSLADIVLNSLSNWHAPTHWLS